MKNEKKNKSRIDSCKYTAILWIAIICFRTSSAQTKIAHHFYIWSAQSGGREKTGHHSPHHHSQTKEIWSEARERASIWCIFEMHLILINVFVCRRWATPAHTSLGFRTHSATSCAIHLSLSLSVSWSLSRLRLWNISGKVIAPSHTYSPQREPLFSTGWLLCGEQKSARERETAPDQFRIARIAQICIDKHKISIN